MTAYVVSATVVCVNLANCNGQQLKCVHALNSNLISVPLIFKATHAHAYYFEKSVAPDEIWICSMHTFRLSTFTICKVHVNRCISCSYELWVMSGIIILCAQILSISAQFEHYVSQLTSYEDTNLIDLRVYSLSQDRLQIHLLDTRSISFLWNLSDWLLTIVCTSDCLSLIAISSQLFVCMDFLKTWIILLSPSKVENAREAIDFLSSLSLTHASGPNNASSISERISAGGSQGSLRDKEW